MPRQKGEKIYCNHCHTAILELMVDVKSGDQVKSKQFKGINGQPDPKPRDFAVCSHCGKSFENAMFQFIFPNDQRR